ncbi:SDR family oxidoreductase [Rhodococcus sp. DMF-1]|uniref:SDR family oxidoreductase n=1 Tax=Rhodococcus sp. DMF-1 TaxID=2907624 RepID=UPI001F21F296|nr:SDR family oxidoreductase [Rhodococcus sp. DMF-1]UIR37963.1 SDR family oxidoreductase [Rhodococcus sp. DMF-1]
MSGHFEGGVCVVTGGASGIGRAVGEALARAGAVVVLADRDSERLAAARESLVEHAGRVECATVDVMRQQEVQHLIEEAASRHGRLDFLFNNAGVGGTLPIGEATLEQWRRIVDLNLWGVIYGIHAALPIMRRQGGGHLVNTASVAGLVPFPYQSLYCTTKFGIVGLSEALRYELAADGIRVSVVCPGNVATRIFETSLMGDPVAGRAPDDSITADEAARTILDAVAAGKGSSPSPRARNTFGTSTAQPPSRSPNTCWTWRINAGPPTRRTTPRRCSAHAGSETAEQRRYGDG